MKRVSNELVFPRDENPVRDGASVLPDDVVDRGEEPKAMRE